MVDSVACEWFGGGMKAILFSLFVGLLIVGCEESSVPSDSSTTPEVLEDATADAVDWSKLQGRNGVMYLRSENTPFSGLGQSWYGRGRKEFEVTLKDGKQDGLSTTWYENGQKSGEENFKDGKLMSAVHWKPNGEECPLTNVKDGTGVSVWDFPDGREYFRSTYKDGEPVK